MTFPEGPADVDSAWLERVLRQEGALPNARVHGLSTERIGEAYGWDSTIARATLRGDGVPATLVLKWCAAKNARCELRVSREIAPRIDVAITRVITAAFDASSDRAVLLLDDVSPARQGDYLATMTRQDGEALVDAMASVHATFWTKTDDLAVAWLPRWVSDVADRVRRTEAAVDPFLKEWGERLSPAAGAAVLALPNRLAASYEALDRAPATLIHADLHVENVLFLADGTPVILDWTDASIGSAAVDFARFRLNGNYVESSREHAAAFRQRYVDGLQARGVSGYGAQELVRDVTHALTTFLAREVRASVDVGFARPSHPHSRAALDQSIRNAAEAAGEWTAVRAR